MVRFDDGIAEKLRERAHFERKSLNRVVNDVVGHYLDAAEGVAEGASPDRAALVENVGRRLQEFRSRLKLVGRKRSQGDRMQQMQDSLMAAADCFAAIHSALSPESVRNFPKK